MSKTVFFDMGNTLLHFHRGRTDEEKDLLGIKKLTIYLKSFNKTIYEKNVIEGFVQKWMELIKLRKTTRLEYSIEPLLNNLLKPYDIQLNHEQCVKAIDLFYYAYKEDIELESDAIVVLKYLKDKGYNIGIISNTCYYEEIMIDCFKLCGLYDYIDEFIFSYSLGLGKPNMEIFNRAISQINIEPYEAIMIGDSIECDIKPAMNLGMKGIWFNKNKHDLTNDYKPDIVINNLKSLLEFL